jgi:hypothetical protein
MNQKKLIDEVRRLASKYPGFRYKGPNKFSSHYFEGGDSRYPEARGCIIGQALRNIGGQRYIPVDGAAGLCASELGLDGTEEEGFWLDDVQQYQVENRSWSTAIEMADEAQRQANPYPGE